MNIKCDQKAGKVILMVLFYDNTDQHLSDAFLQCGIFEYSGDDLIFSPIMRVRTSSQKNNQVSHITLFGKVRGQHLRLINCVEPKSGTTWANNVDEIDASVKVLSSMTKVNGKLLKTLRSYLTLEWELPTTSKPIKFFRIRGDWKIYNIGLPDLINQIYPLRESLNSKIIEKTPLELNDEISNDVKVIGGADGITVTGAEPGINIKVYNASGVELKSVVANDDIVNFKLPKKKIYTVKVGTESYSVAL